MSLENLLKKQSKNKDTIEQEKREDDFIRKYNNASFADPNSESSAIASCDENVAHFYNKKIEQTRRINSILNSSLDRTRLVHRDQIDNMAKKKNLKFSCARDYKGDLPEDFDDQISDFGSKSPVTENITPNLFFLSTYKGFEGNSSSQQPLMAFYKIDDEYYYLISSWGKESKLNSIKRKVQSFLCHPISTFLTTSSLWYLLGYGLYSLDQSASFTNFFVGWSILGVMLFAMGGFFVVYILMRGMYNLLTPYGDKKEKSKEIGFYNKLND